MPEPIKGVNFTTPSAGDGFLMQMQKWRILKTAFATPAAGIAPLEDRMKKVEEIIDISNSLRAFGIVVMGYLAESK